MVKGERHPRNSERYNEVTMRDPPAYQCMEWKELPTIPEEDRKPRLFLLSIFFGVQDESENFTSDDLATTLTNAFSAWHCPPSWDNLRIREIERTDKIDAYTTRELINELQRRKALIKIDPRGEFPEGYGKIIICPNNCIMGFCTMTKERPMEYLRLVFNNQNDAYTEWCTKPASVDCFKDTGCGNCHYLVRKPA